MFPATIASILVRDLMNDRLAGAGRARRPGDEPLRRLTRPVRIADPR